MGGAIIIMVPDRLRGCECTQGWVILSSGDPTPPNGHWHLRWSNKGNELLRQWVATPVTKYVHLYLKRAGTGPKGKGQGEV